MAIVISLALLFVGIGVLVIIHTCVVGRAFRRGFTNSNSNNTAERSSSSSFGSRSMSRDEIEKLPRFDFRGRVKKGSSSITSSPVDCAVCLENFMAGDKCRLLPVCSHSFHAECIDLWLLKTPICPVCRSCADAELLMSMTGPGLISGEESSSRSITAMELSVDGAEVRRVQLTEDSGFVAVSINEDSLVTNDRPRSSVN